MTYCTDIPIHGRILSVIEDIWNGKEDLRDDMVSKIIQDLYGRHRLGGFNKNQIGDLLPGFDMR